MKDLQWELFKKTGLVQAYNFYRICEKGEGDAPQYKSGGYKKR